MHIVIRLFPVTSTPSIAAAVWVFVLLNTLNCAVRLLPLLASCFEVVVDQRSALSQQLLVCCDDVVGAFSVSDVISFRLG
jgi:hypothetical protein